MRNKTDVPHLPTKHEVCRWIQWKVEYWTRVLLPFSPPQFLVEWFSPTPPAFPPARPLKMNFLQTTIQKLLTVDTFWYLLVWPGDYWECLAPIKYELPPINHLKVINHGPFWHLSVEPRPQSKNLPIPHPHTTNEPGMCNHSKIINQGKLSSLYRCFSLICMSVHTHYPM